MRSLLMLALMPAMVLSQSPEQLYRDRKYPETRAAAQAQLAANKNDASAMYWMGQVARVEGKSSDAIDWYEKAVKADDKNARYHFALGNAVGDVAQNASKLKQPFMARRIKAEFEKAVALDPTMIDARDGLIGFYQQAPGFMGGSTEKAKEQVAEIRKLNAYRGHLSAGTFYTREKDWPSVVKEFEAAIALHPDSAQGYYSLTGHYRRQSLWDDALTVYDRLMKAKPDEIIAHLGYGATASLSGKPANYERGERELRTFIAGATLEKVGMANLAGSHFRLGQILEKTNRRDQAKSEYEETLKVNPQHADAKKALAALK